MLAMLAAKNWGSVISAARRVGFPEMARRRKRWAWLGAMKGPNDLTARFIKGRTGPYREAAAFLMTEMTAGFLESLEEIHAHPKLLVLHEDMVPSEILRGMGLVPWTAELLGIMTSVVSIPLGEQMIDIAESHGIPPDTCSLPKVTMGLVLADQMPRPRVMVASNMPCDGGMSSYSLMEKELGVPSFRLDVPFNFHSDRAVDYFVVQLKEMIAWLERHTPGRMDWDRMRLVCERRNEAARLEMELWDLLMQVPAPLAAEPVYFSHLMFMVGNPGSDRSIRVMARMLEYARTNVREGRGALPRERHRAILWNPPTLSFPDLWVWAEEKYQVAMIMDMLTFNRHPYIDTSTPDTILRSLCHIIMEGPMAQHTRGPAENFFSDLFSVYERFSADMIWMAGHVGCKNTMALSGMFREKCRERNIPLLILSYDLHDTRVVSPAEMRAQVDSFMEAVMGRGA